MDESANKNGLSFPLSGSYLISVKDNQGMEINFWKWIYFIILMQLLMRCRLH